MNNHSRLSKDELEQEKEQQEKEQVKQKKIEIMKVIEAYEKKKKDIHQAVKEICKIIDSIPDTILDDKLKNYCRTEFEKAEKEPSCLSVAIKKVLAVICFVLNPKENIRILKNTSTYIALEKLEKAENETSFALRNKSPKTFKDSVLNELSNIKFGAY